MYLSKLKIKNFRAIDELIVRFTKGLTVLVGENNVGKTAIMDALRLVTIPANNYDALRVTVDDFHNGNIDVPIEVSAEFFELCIDDEIGMYEAVVVGDDEHLYAQLNTVSSYNAEGNRIKTRASGGLPSSGNPINNAQDYIDVTYLKPLRDPGQALKNGRFSYPAMYLSSNLDKQHRESLEKIAQEFNKALKENPGIGDVERLYNEVFKSITGDVQKQIIELVFNQPDFARLISDVKTKIDSMEYSLNGLGLNNVLVIALVLAAHRHISDRYKILIIEEPEAHLHPILQRLLLTYLQSVANDEGSRTQVVISTHSPIFASKVKVKNICYVSKKDGLVQSVSLSDAVRYGAADDDVNYLSRRQENKLERYLDATRAELFFCHKIMLVEGVAEMFILPSIARIVNEDFDVKGVTLINCLGLNFEMFITVSCKLDIRVAVVTDTDRPAGEATSDYCQKLQEIVKGKKNVKVFASVHTLERSLFSNVMICRLAQGVVKDMGHQTISRRCASLDGDNLYEYLFGCNDNKSKARISKGEFAQEFARKLDGLSSDGRGYRFTYEVKDKIKQEWVEREGVLKMEDFPENLIKAIIFVCGGEKNG